MTDGIAIGGGAVGGGAVGEFVVVVGFVILLLDSVHASGVLFEVACRLCFVVA